MNRTAIFAFKGNPVCFVHVLLNAIDLHKKGNQVKVVLEGEATKLITELGQAGHPLHTLYKEVKKQGLIDAVCRACAVKMGTLEAAKAEGFRIADDMAGHAGMLPYIEQGYAIITL
jgi:hypothetical protein